MAFSRRKRIRRVAKWVGVVFVVLLLAADMLSTWCVTQVDVHRCTAMVVHGRLYLYRTRHSQPAVFFGCGRTQPHRDWWFDTWGDWSEGYVYIPIWSITVCLGAGTVLLWWLDKRDRGPGFCQKCSYNLAGLVPGPDARLVCPECGRS